MGFLRGLPSGVGKPVVSQGSPNSCFSYCPFPQDEGEGRDGNSLGLPNPVIPSPPVGLLAFPLPQDSQKDGEQRRLIFRDSSCKPPPLSPAALFSQCRILPASAQGTPIVLSIPTPSFWSVFQIQSRTPFLTSLLSPVSHRAQTLDPLLLPCRGLS